MTDGKCPDDLTLTPWKEGRFSTWDVTVTDTVAASYLNATSACAGSAAEAAAARKQKKYSEVGCDFLSSLDHRLSLVSDDLVNLFSTFNAFQFLFSASTQFVSAILSGNCLHNFLTSQLAKTCLVYRFSFH